MCKWLQKQISITFLYANINIVLRWPSSLIRSEFQDCRNLDSSVTTLAGVGMGSNLLTYPEADLVYFDFELKIHIGSSDCFANGTACLTAD